MFILIIVAVFTRKNCNRYLLIPTNIMLYTQKYSRMEGWKSTLKFIFWNIFDFSVNFYYKVFLLWRRTAGIRYLTCTSKINYIRTKEGMVRNFRLNYFYVFFEFPFLSKCVVINFPLHLFGPSCGLVRVKDSWLFRYRNYVSLFYSLKIIFHLNNLYTYMKTLIS